MNKFLVSLLLLVGGAFAADCDKIVINSQSDVDQFSGCSQASSITVTGNTTTEVVLESLGQAGTIKVSNTQNLITFSLPSVQKITTLEVVGNVQLTNVDLSRLQNADSIKFTENPNLNPPKFSNATSIRNVDFTNTAISSISGLSLTQADSITFSGNGNLTTINFDKLTKINKLLYVAGNHPTINAKFPKLSSIGAACTISNVTSFDLSSLESTGTFLSLTYNTASNFSLPKLTKVGQGLTASANPNIKSIDFPVLQSLGGGLLIANNTELGNISFPKLKNIDGALDLTGNFDKIDFPAIELIKGTWNVQSQSSKLVCDDVKNSIQKAVKGSKTSTGCKSGVSDPKSESDPNNTGSNGFQTAVHGSLTMATVFLVTLLM
jgi:hypothetical protein